MKIRMVKARNIGNVRHQKGDVIDVDGVTGKMLVKGKWAEDAAKPEKQTDDVGKADDDKKASAGKAK